MRISSQLLASTSMAIVLTAAAIIVILFATNLSTIANAQQQQQQPSNQTAAIENGTLFQSTVDNFRVQVPEGWIIQDVNNTGFILEAEVLQGYGILAQLCPQEQQRAAPDVGGNGSGSSIFSSICQGSEGDIIHIVRYPNLDARLGFTPEDIISDYNNTANTIISYQIQKLQEVGYSDIRIVNSTDTTINIDISTAASGMIDNDNTNALPAATVPAKLVEMTYRTDFAPNEIRTGQFILTATDATSPNLGMITGYSIFYEGNSAATAEEETTTLSGSLAPIPLPVPVRQVFNSFELIASEETVQAILAALAAQAEQAQQLEQVEQTVTVQTEEVVEEPITPLAGELISNGTEGIAPATFEFDTNIRGGIEPYTINWDFGDGSQESDKESVVHTFDEAGTYTVTATVIDSAGQVGSASMGITVEEPSPPANETEEVIPPTEEPPANETEEVIPEDTTPPVITVPDDITEEATGPDGATVSFEVSAEDDVDGPVDASCDPNSGEIFPIGQTVVTCTAQDFAGNIAEESFTITVEEPPADDDATTEEPSPPSPAAEEEGEEETTCDPSYPDVCISPPQPDLDCPQLSERNFEVLPPDPHGFDPDNDGIGCEGESNQDNTGSDDSDNNSGSDDPAPDDTGSDDSDNNSGSDDPAPEPEQEQ
jgi:PKD repeat protein